MAGLLPLLGLGGCGPGENPPWKAEAPKAPTGGEAAYVAPPIALASSMSQTGVVVLSGSAAPGATVRLGTPSGEVLSAVADDKGAWTATAPKVDTVRLYGLSMVIDDRTVQSEGYLALTADGGAAQLRAGTAARVMSPPSRRPRILAIDYDRDGGAVVSGVGTPSAAVGLRVNRVARGDAMVDRHGRFAIPLSQPLGAGPHEFEVAAEGGEDLIEAATARQDPPQGGPYRATRTAQGWQIDWMTPGGGLQTTLLFDRRG
ncbi:MAG: hypothetical protein V4466_01555 [Pseudomonadota bacterium]